MLNKKQNKKSTEKDFESKKKFDVFVPIYLHDKF
jgi:hypothetical protein